MMHAKKNEWLTFAVDSSLPEVPAMEELHENVTEIDHEPELEFEGEEEESSLLFVKSQEPEVLWTSTNAEEEIPEQSR
jgi:hypothetical protein